MRGDQRLREAGARAIYESACVFDDRDAPPWDEVSDATRLEYLANADAVLGVVLERERLLRERIMALRDEPHTTPPCRRAHTADDAYDRVLRVFDA